MQSWILLLVLAHPGLSLEHNHHKGQSLRSNIRFGEIINHEGQTYMAKMDSNNLDFKNKSVWCVLHHGSFLWPKQYGDDLVENDIVKTSHGYAIVADDNSVLELLDYNEKEKWMTNLRPAIGDRRLGDLAIPGTHDSGTEGIKEDSYLVDRNFLFGLGEIFTPMTLVNWSRTHDSDLRQQLEQGFRWFDLRIADVEIYDDTFRWWHGLTGDVIYPGLQDIRDFALNNPEEIIICYFQHFAMPGNSINPTRPIPDNRKIELSDIIMSYLGDLMVDPSSVSSNPTVNEVLSTGNNIITIMRDGFIQDLDDLYWPNVIHSSWSGRTNPEDLFNERSSKLEGFRINYPDVMTDISGACTPNEKNIVAGMLRVYGDNPNITDIIESVAPGILEIDPDMMSFEGLFTDLVLMSRDGVNTDGQHARNADLYTSGSSVHYRGLNQQYRYWLARPDKYKPNIIYVDDSDSSDVVLAAIEANMGLIPREVIIAVQGSSRHGFYTWDQFTAVGGQDGLNCSSIITKITINGNTWELTSGEVVITEGQYPENTEIYIDVRNMDSDIWRELYSGNIQEMIDNTMDLYIRGNGPDINDLESYPDEWGFAYASTNYNTFAPNCNTPPLSGYLSIVQWG